MDYISFVILHYKDIKVNKDARNDVGILFWQWNSRNEFEL